MVGQPEVIRFVRRAARWRRFFRCSLATCNFLSTVGLNLLVMPGEHVLRRDITDDAVQTDVIVALYVTLTVEKYRAAQAAGTWQPNPAIGFFPTSIGRLYRLELDKRSEWYQIYFEYDTGGFQVGDLVAYDLTDGNFAQYAVNVRRALAVPSIKHKRVLGFTYQLYDADLAVCTSPSS